MVRPRTMKITALSVVFLIVTLAVPHVSLWNIGFGAGKAEGQAVPTLTINPTTASTGTVMTYSVTNAAPNSGIFLFCFDSSGGASKCSRDPFCTTNAQGACTFSVTSDLPTGKYREYVTDHIIASNDIEITITGSDSACSGATGVVCQTISPSLNYINGYFERGLCLSNLDKAYQCYLPFPNVKDCRSCIAQTTNFQGSSGIKYQWCQSISDSSKGYCSYSPYSYECLSSHREIRDANSCPVVAGSNDDSGCTNLGGRCETVTTKTGGYYATNLCMSQPTTQNYQCFIPDPSINSCSDCTSGISSWCQKGTSGYCAINAPCVPNEGYTALAVGHCSDSGAANKIYRCTKNNVCISILSTDDPKAYCAAQGDYPAGAYADYGAYTADSYNKCLQDAGSGTSSGQITFASTTPSPVPANTAFSITFSVPQNSAINRLSLKMLSSSGTQTSYTISTFPGSCPPSCTTPIPALQQGAYNYYVEAFDSSGKTTGITGQGTITIGSGTGAAVTQLCEQCLQGSNNFFCASTGYTGSTNILGTCKINGKNDNAAIQSCAPPYYQPIYQENIAQCPKPLSCQEQCINLVYGGSYGTSPLGTVPYGQCSLTAPVSFGGSIGGVNTGVTIRAVPYGKGPIVGCNENFQDTCWCTTVNPTTSGGLGIFGTTNFGLSSIPGTTQIPKWPGDPDEIKNPRVAETNQLVCDAPSDATIIAKVSPQLAQAGEQITVSGDVGRISETCTGYERTCRKITQVGCQIKDRVLWQTLSCNECPAGSDWPGGKSYSCIGEARKPRWSVILGITLVVTCAFVPTTCAKAISAITSAGSKAGGVYILGGYAAQIAGCSVISQGIFTAGKCTDNSQCASGQCIRDTGKCVPKIPDLGDGGATGEACSARNCGACDPGDKCPLTPGCKRTDDWKSCVADETENMYFCTGKDSKFICTTNVNNCLPAGPVSKRITAAECATRKALAEKQLPGITAAGSGNPESCKKCISNYPTSYPEDCKEVCSPAAPAGGGSGDCPSGIYSSYQECLQNYGGDHVVCDSVCGTTGSSGTPTTGPLGESICNECKSECRDLYPSYSADYCDNVCKSVCPSSGTGNNAACTLNNHKCDGNALYICASTRVGETTWSPRSSYSSTTDCQSNCNTLAAGAGGRCESSGTPSKSGTTAATISVSHLPQNPTSGQSITLRADASGSLENMKIYFGRENDVTMGTIAICGSVSSCTSRLNLIAGNYKYYADGFDPQNRVTVRDPANGYEQLTVAPASSSATGDANSCQSCVTASKTWCIQDKKCIDSGDLCTQGTTFTQTPSGCSAISSTGAATAGGISVTGRQTGIPGGVPPIRAPAGTTPVVGGVAGALGGAAFGLCVGQMIDSRTPALNPAACISVCGKKYETAVGPSPVCDGAVVGEQPKSYKCTAGSCEGFPNKDVQITVYDSKGEVAAQTTTKTDAAGHFDYTFTAPQVEGEYTVSAVVPGLRASTTTTGNVASSNAVTPLVP